uniref:Kazal-like domain-containing protein n=1 Tax=Chromera velia CCMP2878 TaxID=1169474 RepID=A0A0G4GPA6_9ALVE|eukprot:Cvel_22745.t1-p1 / transcript=Cvel_22745.t1 / gene=Cvel_22745 / organism=Chromera_velia_CCMP2878 / gene_product=hypothetical protein / transcript_product=hypothetical protein / location=Cvel_scaffold2269:18412-21026(-) / protein_length=382 / sequence_SO=supercontig / SO=protein_coding / is_pseudo=false
MARFSTTSRSAHPSHIQMMPLRLAGRALAVTLLCSTALGDSTPRLESETRKEPASRNLFGFPLFGSQEDGKSCGLFGCSNGGQGGGGLFGGGNPFPTLFRGSTGGSSSSSLPPSSSDTIESSNENVQQQGLFTAWLNQANKASSGEYGSGSVGLAGDTRADPLSGYQTNLAQSSSQEPFPKSAFVSPPHSVGYTHPKASNELGIEEDLSGLVGLSGANGTGDGTTTGTDEGVAQVEGGEDGAGVVYFCPRGCLQYYDGCDVCECSPTGRVTGCMGRKCPKEEDRCAARCIHPTDCVIKECPSNEPYVEICANDEKRYYSQCKFENRQCATPLICQVACPEDVQKSKFYNPRLQDSEDNTVVWMNGEPPAESTAGTVEDASGT